MKNARLKLEIVVLSFALFFAYAVTNGGADDQLIRRPAPTAQKEMSMRTMADAFHKRSFMEMLTSSN